MEPAVKINQGGKPSKPNITTVRGVLVRAQSVTSLHMNDQEFAERARPRTRSTSQGRFPVSSMKTILLACNVGLMASHWAADSWFPQMPHH